MSDTVLITGGTGCIGSNLAAALLAQGRHVRILRRASSDPTALKGIDADYVIGDVRDPESLRTAINGCSLVFHAAALVGFSAKHREEQYRVNVLGTRNVVDACLAAGARKLVHVSSIAALGYAAPGTVADERTPFVWKQRTGYKFSKHLAEQEILNGVSRGLDAAIVNPSVVVGERDIHFRGGQLVRDARRGLLVVAIKGGMNVVYVGDVVRGMIAAAERGRPGERYILCGENLTHKEIFRRTAKIVGRWGPVATIPTPALRLAAHTIEAVSALLKVNPLLTGDLVANAGKFNWYSCAKAQRELGYTFTPFDDAIRAAYRWYRENGYL
jgi:dihydroflavonol-4-reductase